MNVVAALKAEVPFHNKQLRMSFFGKGVVTFIKGLEAYFTVLD
jgi:hypothetical protein